jgi:hypothetical protein
VNDTLTIESWEAQWEVLSDPLSGPETAFSARRALLSAFRLLARLGLAGVDLDTLRAGVALVPGNGWLIWDIEACGGNLAPALDLAAGELIWVDVLRRAVGRLSLREADPSRLLRLCASLGLDEAAEVAASFDSEVCDTWNQLDAAKSERMLAEYGHWYSNAARFLDSWHGRAERVLAHGLDPETGSYVLVVALPISRNPNDESECTVRIGLEIPADGSEGPLWFVEPVEDRRPDWLAPLPGLRWRDGSRVRAELPASALTQVLGIRSQATMLRGFVDHAIRIFAATPIA